MYFMLSFRFPHISRRRDIVVVSTKFVRSKLFSIYKHIWLQLDSSNACRFVYAFHFNLQSSTMKRVCYQSSGRRHPAVVGLLRSPPMTRTPTTKMTQMMLTSVVHRPQRVVTGRARLADETLSSRACRWCLTLAARSQCPPNCSHPKRGHRDTDEFMILPTCNLKFLEIRVPLNQTSSDRQKSLVRIGLLL